MTKLLSEAEVAGYRDRGYLFPVNALSASEVTDFRRKLEDYEAATGGPIKAEMRHRSHVLFSWIDEMVRHPSSLMPSRTCWVRTSCAGTPASSSRKRMIRVLYPGIRMRPIGASVHPMWRPPGSRCRRPTRFPAA